MFVYIAQQIPSLPNTISVIACFETICGVRQRQVLQREHPYICNRDDVVLILMKIVTGLLQNIGLNDEQVPPT